MSRTSTDQPESLFAEDGPGWPASPIVAPWRPVGLNCHNSSPDMSAAPGGLLNLRLRLCDPPITTNRVKPSPRLMGHPTDGRTDSGLRPPLKGMMVEPGLLFVESYREAGPIFEARGTGKCRSSAYPLLAVLRVRHLPQAWFRWGTPIAADRREPEQLPAVQLQDCRIPSLGITRWLVSGA